MMQDEDDHAIFREAWKAFQKDDVNEAAQQESRDPLELDNDALAAEGAEQPAGTVAQRTDQQPPCQPAPHPSFRGPLLLSRIARVQELIRKLTGATAPGGASARGAVAQAAADLSSSVDLASLPNRPASADEARQLPEGCQLGAHSERQQAGDPEFGFHGSGKASAALLFTGDSVVLEGRVWHLFAFACVDMPSRRLLKRAREEQREAPKWRRRRMGAVISSCGNLDAIENCRRKKSDAPAPAPDEGIADAARSSGLPLADAGTPLPRGLMAWDDEPPEGAPACGVGRVVAVRYHPDGLPPQRNSGNIDKVDQHYRVTARFLLHRYEDELQNRMRELEELGSRTAPPPAAPEAAGAAAPSLAASAGAAAGAALQRGVQAAPAACPGPAEGLMQEQQQQQQQQQQQPPAGAAAGGLLVPAAAAQPEAPYPPPLPLMLPASAAVAAAMGALRPPVIPEQRDMSDYELQALLQDAWAFLAQQHPEAAAPAAAVAAVAAVAGAEEAAWWFWLLLWAGADISVVRRAAEVLQARGVQLSQLRHPFLERTVLHALCTLDFFWNALPPLPPTGRCEPPSGSLLLRLPRLPDAARLARLEWLRLEHPDQLKAMRLEPNASGAVPAFTALHFCIPCVVIWLVTEFQLTMPELLRPTKRGKLPLLLMSSEAARLAAAQPEDARASDYDECALLLLSALPGIARRHAARKVPGEADATALMQRALGGPRVWGSRTAGAAHYDDDLLMQALAKLGGGGPPGQGAVGSGGSQGGGAGAGANQEFNSAKLAELLREALMFKETAALPTVA